MLINHDQNSNNSFLPITLYSRVSYVSMISSILVVYAVNLCVIGYAVSKLLYYSVLGGAAAAPWQQQQKAGSSSAVKGQAPPAPAASGAAPSTPRQQASASEDEWGKVCALMIMVCTLVIATIPVLSVC